MGNGLDQGFRASGHAVRRGRLPPPRAQTTWESNPPDFSRRGRRPDTATAQLREQDRKTLAGRSAEAALLAFSLVAVSAFLFSTHPPIYQWPYGFITRPT